VSARGLTSPAPPAHACPMATGDPATLQDAQKALRSGDFGGARRTLLRLRPEVKSDEDRQAAEDLLWRFRPDPAAFVLLGVSLVLFVLVVALMH